MYRNCICKFCVVAIETGENRSIRHEHALLSFSQKDGLFLFIFPHHSPFGTRVLHSLLFPSLLRSPHQNPSPVRAHSLLNILIL